MMTRENVPSLVIILESALQIPVSVNRDTVNAAVQESVVRKPRIRGHLSLSLSPSVSPKRAHTTQELREAKLSVLTPQRGSCSHISEKASWSIYLY